MAMSMPCASRSRVPPGSRAGRPEGFLSADEITPERIGRVRRLGELAVARGQSLAQMAVAWVLRQEAVTSALIGASRVEHIEDAVGAVERREFSAAELSAIDRILQ